jgi:acyl-coenzyme A thioesterase PaaI-like protein
MSLTDTLGSLAVASRGQYMTGVSTDISTSFVKPAGKPGDELKVTATLTAMGAFTQVHRPAYTRLLVRALRHRRRSGLGAVLICSFFSLLNREIAGVHPGRFS